MSEEFSVVGKKIIREDGVEKVTGRAKFADDYKFPGMLHAVMVRINEAHAKINEIDFSALENEPAVSIVSASDVHGSKKVGMIKNDQPVFCSEKVVTPGDVVAMLVGESESKLRSLLPEIKIDYTPLPVLTDPEKSLNKNSVLIHPETGSNLIVHHPLRKGDVEKGFEESDEILEQTYKTQLIEHAYIEPEAVVAIPLGFSEGIKIIGSIQNPFTARKFVANVLNYPLAKVRVQQAHLGGSFGGKDDTMCILSARAAVAAIKTNRPVKIKYTREESVLESYKRHPYILKYKVGYNLNGKIKAMKIDILADGGAYASMSPFVTWRSVVQASGPYEIENVQTDVRAVYTNNPYTGAMRGFGSPQPIFAQESLIDEIASRLGISPDEIRRINGFKNGSVTATGQILKDHDVNLKKVLDVACGNTDFITKWKSNRDQKIFSLKYDPSNPILKDNQFIDPPENIRKGIGLAVSFRGCSLGAEGIDAASAYLSVQNDGSIYLDCGLAENGQGLRTTYSIIAAEVLGVSAEKIIYLELDTGITPESGPTVASRATLMGGSAVKNAAEILRDRLINLIKEEFKLGGEDVISFRDDLVFSRKKGLITKFTDLCKLAASRGINLSAIGWYKSPKVDWNEENGQGDAYFTYVYGCQIAEVSVNVSTGEVYIDKVTAVHDPGKVINKLGAEGQVYGGVTQGAGYGIFEEVTADNGFIRELNFDTYTIPTSMDIGEIKPVFVEGKENYGPWGAKSLGEPTLELTAAAIANAVSNAVGRRFYSLPLNLEEIILNKKLRPAGTKRGSSL